MVTNASIANPRRGNINADTVEGKKMILKMTQGLSEDGLFEMKQKNIDDFKEIIEEDATAFYCVKVLHSIPLSHNEEGTLATSSNLLTEAHLRPKFFAKDFASQV